MSNLVTEETFIHSTTAAGSNVSAAKRKEKPSFSWGSLAGGINLLIHSGKPSSEFNLGIIIGDCSEGAKNPTPPGGVVSSPISEATVFTGAPSCGVQIETIAADGRMLSDMIANFG